MAEVKTGIQCFDEDGNCILDVTNRICKYLGTGNTGLEDGSLQNDLLIGHSSVWLVPTGINLGVGNLDYSNCIIPYFYVDGESGILSWKYDSGSYAAKIGYSFIYGVV